MMGGRADVQALVRPPPRGLQEVRFLSTGSRATMSPLCTWSSAGTGSPATLARNASLLQRQRLVTMDAGWLVLASVSVAG